MKRQDKVRSKKTFQDEKRRVGEENDLKKSGVNLRDSESVSLGLCDPDYLNYLTKMKDKSSANCFENKLFDHLALTNERQMLELEFEF